MTTRWASTFLLNSTMKWGSTLIRSTWMTYLNLSALSRMVIMSLSMRRTPGRHPQGHYGSIAAGWST